MNGKEEVFAGGYHSDDKNYYTPSERYQGEGPYNTLKAEYSSRLALYIK